MVVTEISEKEKHRARLVAEVEALNGEILALAGEPMPQAKEELELKIARHQRLLGEVTGREELLHKFFRREPTPEERISERGEKLR